jgi:hypothetical protein
MVVGSFLGERAILACVPVSVCKSGGAHTAAKFTAGGWRRHVGSVPLPGVFSSTTVNGIFIFNSRSKFYIFMAFYHVIWWMV